MPSEASVQQLIREIEVEKGRMTAHERECALRYGRIEDNTTAMKGDIGDIKASVAALAARGTAAAWAANWKAWALAGALLVAMLAAMGWMGGQLYALEPGRVLAAQSTGR